MCPRRAAGFSPRGLAVEEYDFPHQGTHLKATISLGVAEHEPAMTSPEEVLKKADDALYAAKRDGRNRVNTADQIVPSPTP